MRIQNFDEYPFWVLVKILYQEARMNQHSDWIPLIVALGIFLLLNWVANIRGKKFLAATSISGNMTRLGIVATVFTILSCIIMLMLCAWTKSMGITGAAQYLFLLLAFADLSLLAWHFT